MKPKPPPHPALLGWDLAHSAPAPDHGQGAPRSLFGAPPTWDGRQPDLDDARIVSLHAQGRTTAQIAAALGVRFVHVAEWFRRRRSLQPHRPTIAPHDRPQGRPQGRPRRSP